MIQLRELHLYKCTRLESLPWGYSALQSLEVLNLHHTRILALPEGLSRLQRLHTLIFGGLAEVPDSLSTLSSLRTLGWANCRDVERLLDCISTWSASLESLDLADSPFMALPDRVSQLCGLRSITLSGCYALAALPHSVLGMTALERLALNFCRKISALPPGLGSLPRLSEIDLEGTAYTTLRGGNTLEGDGGSPIRYCLAEGSLRASPGGSPRGFLGGVLRGAPGFNSLQDLNLDSALLEALPEGVCQLISLVWLQLKCNPQLVELPAGISSLVRLQSLDVSECTALVRLPESIRHLTALEASINSLLELEIPTLVDVYLLDVLIWLIYWPYLLLAVPTFVPLTFGSGLGLKGGTILLQTFML